MKSVHDINNIRTNPILMNVQTAWPNFNIPVMISSNFSDIDSIKIRNWLTWRNNYSGRNIFNFAAFDTTSGSTAQGIYVYPGTSSSSQRALTPDYKYIRAASCKLNAPYGPVTILKEVSGRALTFPLGNSVIYTPSNYELAASVITQPKDEAYMTLAYMLQHLKQTDKNDLDINSIQDSINVLGIAGNPSEQLLSLEEKILRNISPNPARHQAQIEYSLLNPIHMHIDIYNIAGQKVRTLLDGYQTLGLITQTWDLKNDSGVKVSPGMYFVNLHSSNTQWSATGRITVIR